MARTASHGHAIEGQRSRVYDIWRGLRQRCTNPKATGFIDYGGRGISVTPSWDKFPAFIEWAEANGYADHLSIERRDVDGNYCPDNCYWADSTVQACNKRKRAGRFSQYIGVSPNKKGWQVNINYKGEHTYLGTFADEKEAALLRDAHITKMGWPHKLNF